jgi:hypothetical protein
MDVPREYLSERSFGGGSPFPPHPTFVRFATSKAGDVISLSAIPIQNPRPPTAPRGERIAIAVRIIGRISS